MYDGMLKSKHEMLGKIKTPAKSLDEYITHSAIICNDVLLRRADKSGRCQNQHLHTSIKPINQTVMLHVNMYGHK